ncbi:MAG: hypothetical protein DMG90_21055 [Acidobacteria bacterium]|nr:MAG: hypothetical protein DMG90_21055 [Acidobacteriota bacterium]
MNFEQVPLEKVKDQIARGEISLMSAGDDAPQPCRQRPGGRRLQPEVRSAMREEKKQWVRLCELAAVEQDPQKLLALITEINRLLEEE